MGLTNESKNIVDKEIRVIACIVGRLKENEIFDSDNFLVQTALVIYSKRGNDLRFDDDNDD